MKRVWRTLLLSGLVTSVGYATLLVAGDGTAYRHWSDRLLRAASPDDGARQALVKSTLPAEVLSKAAAGVSETPLSERPVVLPQLVSPRFAEARDDSLPKPFSNTRDAGSATAGPAKLPPPESVSPIQRPRIPAENRPTAEDARRRLASSIQSELKRVGCFAGEADGDWSVATQRAMRDFNGRINASLPVEQPDYILLTLLQGHAERACAPGCTDDQLQSGAGACQPRRTVASKPQPSPPATPDRTATALVPTPPAPKASTQTPPRPSAEVVLGAPEIVVARPAQPEPRRSDTAPPQETVARRETDQQRIDREREQARLAAAVDRRNKEAAERNAARQEADRLARLAEAERARAREEAKRLAALVVPVPATGGIQPPPGREATANPTPRAPQPAGAPPAANQNELASGQAQVVPPSVTPTRPLKPAKKAQPETRQRIAARPQLRPPYSIGRLPPRYAYWGPIYVAPPARPQPTARRGSTRAIFPYLSRFSP